MKRLATQLLTLKIASFLDLMHTVVFPNPTVCKSFFLQCFLHIIYNICMYADNFFMIAYKYLCSSGVNQWRDQLKPSQILENLARLKGLPPPHIAEDGSSLSFGGRDYNLQDLGISGVIQ